MNDDDETGIWVDLATGEIVPAGTPDAVFLHDDEDPQPPPRLARELIEYREEECRRNEAWVAALMDSDESDEDAIGDPPPPAERPDMSWLGDWLTRKLAEQAAAESALKLAYQAATRRHKAQRARLASWEREMQSVVDADLVGSKKRSVVYAYGSAGYRKSTRIVVEDEAAAIEWAAEHAPDAVKIERTLRKSLLPPEAPGVERVKVDTFFVRPA